MIIESKSVSTSFHILNGDCLASQLMTTSINQNFIVCRESLIEGEVLSDNLSDFWKIRATYIANTHCCTPAEYYSQTVTEIEKVMSLPEKSEVCLWFENDLFCQTNLWFIISLLSDYPTLSIYRIFPLIKSNDDLWSGFGSATAEDLEQAFRAKVLFSPEDINLGKNLWVSYQKNDLERLMAYSRVKSNCFEYLEEICQAHAERFPTDNTPGRPERVLKEIIATKSNDFNTVFSEFCHREGIYGMGDTQIKSLFDKLM